VLNELSERFDVVILDSPPVLGLADAPLMAAIVEGVVMVVQSDRSRRGSLRASLRRLARHAAQRSGRSAYDVRCLARRQPLLGILRLQLLPLHVRKRELSANRGKDVWAALGEYLPCRTPARLCHGCRDQRVGALTSDEGIRTPRPFSL
jgi:hypothetical protein